MVKFTSSFSLPESSAPTHPSGGRGNEVKVRMTFQPKGKCKQRHCGHSRLRVPTMDRVLGSVPTSVEGPD